MSYDVLIRGGHIVDPSGTYEGIYDVAIAGGIIAAIAPQVQTDHTTHIVDAAGQYLTPGLVDLHTHCYWGATYWGVEADPIAARTGVTTWLDAGSAGAFSFPGFRRYVVETARTRIFALLNISSIGLIAPTYELSNLAYGDVDLAVLIVEDNRDIIRGIKARVDRMTTQGTGLVLLQRARELADRVGLPLMVHIGSAPPPLEEIAALLHPGDILTHCCTGQDNRLIDTHGRFYPFIRRLSEQGLVLDLGHGSGSFSYAVAEAMLDAGVIPDVLSSDIHQMAVLGPMYDLPTTLSKFLNLGLSLRDVISRATQRPAALLGRPDLGVLQVGAPADLALFRLEDGEYTFYDVAMQRRQATVRLVNTATYSGGELLPRSPERPPAPWVARDFPPQQRRLLHPVQREGT